MERVHHYKYLFLWVLLVAPWAAHATEGSCSVPIDEKKSAPAIDLLLNNAPLDPDELENKILSGFDSSILEPQKSNLYTGDANSVVEEITYPSDSDALIYEAEITPAIPTFIRARISSPAVPGVVYQMNFTLDTHAALARHTLFRKLGYAIPAPRYYPKASVTFPSLDERNRFIDLVAERTVTSRGRWIEGGIDELNKNNLTVVFHSVALEPAIVNIPRFHWGLIRSDALVDNIDSRRSVRALIVPLTLLDIPESVNMYAFEPIKVFNESLIFSRAKAEVFESQTSIGDVRWITNKIASLNREDWVKIIRGGHYPIDIENLLIEKTLGRVNQLMSITGQKNFTPFQYNPYITSGNVINGKAVQEFYPGYTNRFTYGDPDNPLRASELGRFFGINLISGALGAVLEKGSEYLQLLTPDRYVSKHNEQLIQDITKHFQDHPNSPYIEPITMWGGPTAGGSVNASRSIVAGTYYGSQSQAQLVDSVSAAVSVGAFLGVSGIKNLGIAVSPQIQYSRSYVHVRPLDYSLDPMKSAWKENWGHLFVPTFMSNLNKVLAGEPGAETDDALKKFFAELGPGEMFIITDGLSGGAGVAAQIPLGAMIGFLPGFGQLSAGGELDTLYGILSRTTITRTKDGIQIYLSKIHSRSFEISLNAQFFVKLIAGGLSDKKGDSHTDAFVLPEHFDDAEKNKRLQVSLHSILKNQNAEILKEDFNSFKLDHDVHAKGNSLVLGPWQRTHQELTHRLEITPPIDPAHPYKPEDLKRTIIQGESLTIKGTDFYGFFSDLLRSIVFWARIGNSAKGIDPSANFLGRSHRFSVETELEITPSRPNHTFTKIQQSFSGWAVRKNKILRMLRRISDELSNLGSNQIKINEDEFAQTKSIQSFNLSSTLLVYEAGLDQVFSKLNIDKVGTTQAYVFLVNLQGQDKYASYCEGHNLDPRLSTGPYSMTGPDESGDAWIEASMGRITRLGCMTPLMQTAFQLRRDLKAHLEVFISETKDQDIAKEKIKWTNLALTKLNQELPLGQLISWFGKGNSFFQVRLSGFRTHDERGDSDYFSNTMGAIDQEVYGGPLSEVSAASQISSNELEARYLSSGF